MGDGSEGGVAGGVGGGRKCLECCARRWGVLGSADSDG